MSFTSGVQGGAPAEIEYLKYCRYMILIPKWLWFKRNLVYSLTSHVPVVTCLLSVLSECARQYLTEREN